MSRFRRKETSQPIDYPTRKGGSKIEKLRTEKSVSHKSFGGDLSAPARCNGSRLGLFFEFFQGLVNHSMITVHIDNLRGKNAHHQAETVFKAFGRALRMAVEPDARRAGVPPSTHGTLPAAP